MTTRFLRRALLFAPVALAVACSSPTNPKYPQPDPPTKPGQDPSRHGTQLPAVQDTLKVKVPAG
jgi:hypothetical protein